MTKTELIKFATSKNLAIASTPGYLLPCVGWMRGFMRSRKYFNHTLEELILIIRDGGLASQIEKESQMFENIKELYDFPQKTKEIIKNWRISRDVFFEKWGELNKQNYFEKVSNEELGKILMNFLEEQTEIWAAPLQADFLGIYSETELFEEFIEKLPISEKTNSHEIFAVISRPSMMSFVSEERISILELAFLYKENHPDFEKRILEHQAKYFWIKNTYRYLQILPVSYFLEVIKEESKRKTEDIKSEIEKIKNVCNNVEKDREKFFKKFSFQKKLEEKLRLTSLLGDWLDERKEFNLKSNHFVFVLASEVAKRCGLKIEEVYCLLPQEIEKLLKQKIVDKEEIKRRLKWLVYVTTKPEQEFLFSGDEAKEITEVFDKEFSQNSEIKEIKGIVASRGDRKNYQGKVRIVHDVVHDIFNEGEVLVTSSTRPEFVPLMRKALCIITDEGGIACHAAIVSRELGKPCIIGTKIATKVLKDGDMVEVSANHGWVKIIK